MKKSYLNLILFGLIGYFAYDAYDFFMSSASPLGTERSQVQVLQKEVSDKKMKVEDAKRFFQTLEVKRSELRAMSEQLGTMKSTLSESLDVPLFMKLVLTEAKRIGLTVTSLSPVAIVRKQYYVEQPFNLTFTGVYVQMIAFLDRLSQAQKIIRVDNFSIKPKGRSNADQKYIELDARVEVKTFYYLGTKEDDLAKNPGAQSGSNSGVKK